MSELPVNRKLAYLTGCYARVGDTFIRREVEQLRRLGWVVHTFSIRRAGSQEQISEEILREQSSTDYILEQGIWTLVWAFFCVLCRHPWRMFRAFRLIGKVRWPGFKSLIWQTIYLFEATYLARELIDRDVQLLHNHIAMNTGTVAMLASELAQIPFSLTIHGPHEFFDAKHWAIGTKILRSKLTVCISEFCKSQCMLNSPRSAWHKLRVVRCGLDSFFLSAAVKEPPMADKLIYVGRLDPEKGIFVLLDAAARIKPLHKDLELLVVGDGMDKVECQNYALQLGLQDNVRFLGWCDSQKVRRLIGECRVLVLPSFAEGIPVVLMEALVLQRPVIATQIAGIPELVRNGENGWLISASSVDELAEAMLHALKLSPHDLFEMGRQGQKQVLQRHCLAIEVEKLSGYFVEVLRDSFPSFP